jgi:hypothetical protein
MHTLEELQVSRGQHGWRTPPQTVGLLTQRPGALARHAMYACDPNGIDGSPQQTLPSVTVPSGVGSGGIGQQSALTLHIAPGVEQHRSPIHTSLVSQHNRPVPRSATWTLTGGTPGKVMVCVCDGWLSPPAGHLFRWVAHDVHSSAVGPIGGTPPWLTAHS